MSIDKILAVAQAEFRALVRSKAFLVSILILPIVIVGMSFSQQAIAKRVDTRPRRFAVLDESGRFYDELAAAARRHNFSANVAAIASGHAAGPSLMPERVDIGGRALDDVRVALSDRVRKQELFAFVEIPAHPERDKFRYYSERTSTGELREWIARTLDDVLAIHPVDGEQLGLWTRDADGRIHAAGKQDELRAIVVPLVPVMLLFFFVVISVPQLMNSVLTEKTSRISEVLLGSLSPTELMTGKLLGSVAVALVLGIAYLTCGLGVAARMGLASAIPPSLIAWFLVFLVLAMLLYGAVAMAVGAACNDHKDAQSLMLPVMLPLMMPMFMLMPVISSPSSALATALSLFPPMTPLVMLLRIGLHPSAPLWQIALGAVGALATTALCVWAAGRIFRVGLLMHGKSATVGQMLRWIASG